MNNHSQPIIIAYTHWAYFSDKDKAQACASEMGDYVTRIQPSIDAGEWLLLAGRDVNLDNLIERHDEVQALVEQYGGMYDGGGTAFDATTGENIPDSTLTGHDDDR